MAKMRLLLFHECSISAIVPEVLLRHIDRNKFDVFMATWSGFDFWSEMRFQEASKVARETKTEFFVGTNAIELEYWIRNRKIDGAFYHQVGGDKRITTLFISSAVPLLFEYNVFGTWCHESSRPEIDRNIVCSDASLEIFRRNGGNIKKGIRIYCPCNTNSFSSKCAERDYSPPIFGRHSRETSAKWHPLNIQILPKVRQEIPEAEFRVIGMPAEYMDMAKNFGVSEMIKIMPSTDDDGIKEFLKGLTVYTHTSAYGESFGRSIAEAMASGLPVITHTGGNDAQAELVTDNFNGYVINLGNELEYGKPPNVWTTPENIELYANRLISLLKCPAMKKEMGERGKHRAIEWLDDPKIAKQFENVFLEEFHKLKREACLVMRKPEDIGQQLDLQQIVADLPENCVMAEIGCYAGESTSVFASKASRIYAVDPWLDFIAHYPELNNGNKIIMDLDGIEERFDMMSKRFPNKIIKIKRTSKEAASQITDASLDAVYIDANHTEEHTAEDIKFWYPKIKPGGLLMGHDYGIEGVKRAVNKTVGEPHKIYPGTSWMIRLPHLHKDINITTSKIKITAIILCKNEEQLLPWALRYYSQYVDEIYVHDNASTDSSKEKITQCKIAKLIPYDTGGVFRDDIHAKIKSNFYRTLNSDWYIIIDIDEFIWHKNGLRNHLESCTQRGITFPIITGYQMIGDGWPIDDGKSQLIDHIKYGIRDMDYYKGGSYPYQGVLEAKFRDLPYDKKCVIHKSVEIFYSPGAHSFNASGKIVTGFNEGLKLLHYRWIDKETTLNRMKWADATLPINWVRYNYWMPNAKCIDDSVEFYNEAKKNRILVVPSTLNLHLDDPELKNLENNSNSKLSELAMWQNFQNKVKARLINFAGDELYLTQSTPSDWYTKSAYDKVAEYAMKEGIRCSPEATRDCEFGALAIQTKALGLVTRAWLDGMIEINFIKKHMNLQEKIVLDIGAGYGRLAVLLSESEPTAKITCVDAVPISTFLCKKYTAAFAPQIKVVTIQEFESLKKTLSPDLAINVHSWSECSLKQNMQWIDTIFNMGTKNIFIVTHDPEMFSWSGGSFRPFLEHYYELISQEKLGIEESSTHTFWRRRPTSQTTSQTISLNMRSHTGLEELTNDMPYGLSMVEVGCYAGESTGIFASKVAKVFAVDPWIDFIETDGFDPNHKIKMCMDGVENCFNKVMVEFPNIIKLKGTSRDISSTFPNKSVDFVYINANHMQTVEDIKYWLPKIKPFGVIGGHSYNREDVSKAVNETIGKPHKTYCDSIWAKRLPGDNEYNQLIINISG